MMTDKTNDLSGDTGRMSSDNTDRDCCPLCGGPNGCAIEAGREVESCWCMRRAIGEDVLASVPLSLRGRTCICPACAAGGK
ncbi:cysteine-rich CWC family protein [Cohnella ginsengisoli]|uniref:Cysteine-rich CWC family protein n=1 Tax=Cohnella ginsengisoli TaxID=425004 RepID=A0A9X4KFK1_9BACL|nr:cysteine-rich CWC family protein [Cohnella ginsengisoli]MDG0790876.1 cysteine-rich CWC family protein [Cohnella ginsengisoli]